MAEKIWLDPSEVATSRTQLELTPWVAGEGIDWGDAEIVAYMADQSRGASPVDYRVPNRNISIPLALKTVGGTAFATARTNIQAKAALFQREGGYIKRLTSSGGTVFADVVNATLKLGGGWGQAHRNYDMDAVLTVETTPDFYGAESTLGDHTETAATELVFTETTIDGDYPARVRMVVDEDDGETQLGLIWSFRCRHYSNAATAAVRYEAEALQPLDTAAATAISGASGGTVVRHTALSTAWTPVVGTNVGGTAFLTHTGTNRVWARLYSTSGTAVQARLVWDVGDLTLPLENSAYRLPGASNFYLADLGEVRLDQVPVGTHRWHGQVQAKGEFGGENVSVDKLWIVNVDEGYGVLSASPQASSGYSVFAARDEFNQAAGTLTAKTLPVGGAWVGAGDADDFSVETVGKTAERTAVSDVDGETGRYAIAGTAVFTAAAVQVDVKTSAAYVLTQHQGVLARYTDTANWLRATLATAAPDPGTVLLQVRKRVAGVDSVLVGERFYSADPTAGYVTLRLLVDDAGRWFVWFATLGSSFGMPILSGFDSALATGGALASGKAGFYDANSSATARTRNYDNFAVWVPTPDAVMFANQSVELRTEGVFREDSTGTAYGPVSRVLGSLPRLPPKGLENRSVEVFVKTSRGDIYQLPDNGIDDTSGRLTYRPCWLFVP